MSKIYRLASIWRNKILRFAKDGEDFSDILTEFDRESFLAPEPRSGPQSTPISSGPQSMRENIYGKTLSNSQGMRNQIVSQVKQEIEGKFNQLNERLSSVIDPLKTHYDTKKAEVFIVDELKKFLKQLSEIQSYFQSVAMVTLDILSSEGEARKEKLMQGPQKHLLEIEEKLEQLDDKMYQILKSNAFQIWPANEQFKGNIHGIYNLMLKTKTSVGVLRGILSNEE
jgi:hypothetical protein